MFSLLLALASLPGPDIARGTQAPKGWIALSPPATAAQWQCANYARDEWRVSPRSGADVAIARGDHSSVVRMDLPDGALLGKNNGEFGGAIEWKTPNGKPEVILPNKNPVAFTQSGASVLVASGLAHLGMDHGEIIRLDRGEHGRWNATRVLDLGSAPTAAYREDADNWIILTNTGVKRIDLGTMTVTKLHENPGWFNVYPNSIAASGQSWLIGARRAVIRLDPEGSGYSEQWLVPGTCRHLIPAPDYGCTCSE